MKGHYLAAFVLAGVWSSPAPAQRFTNLHSLGCPDGTTPCAGLATTGGALYGAAKNYGGGNYGSVFRLGADGTDFTKLCTFDPGANGGNPCGTLAAAGDWLYGTLLAGAADSGGLFAISTHGSGLASLHRFSGLDYTVFPGTNGDGAGPATGLTLSGGTLYGTAGSGGGWGWGCLFAVGANGLGFTNLHSLKYAEGEYPGPLLLAGHTLYGAGAGGGANGYGSLFKINTNGTGFASLHHFTIPDYLAGTNEDGVYPQGSLVLSGNTLYGATHQGGHFKNGTIFRITTNGTGFMVLHHFSATNAAGLNADGASPHAGLVLWSNLLFGTAQLGGSSGCGTVFQLRTDGADYATLHSFTTTNTASGTNWDGAHPLAELLSAGSVLYGTTSTGGAAGQGTVFSILCAPPLDSTPQEPEVVLTSPAKAGGLSLESTTNQAASSWSTVSGQDIITTPAAER